MPIELYSYKQGCRSTPKLRRNQSGHKYKSNPSIDSFTSLRPNSPGLQTLPNSPSSVVSHGSWPSWHVDELPSPAYTRFPVNQSQYSPIDGVMSPLEPVTVDPSQGGEPSSMFFDGWDDRPRADLHGREGCSAGVFNSTDRNKKHEELKPPNELTNTAKHVLTLNLRPSQVAVIKDARHESELTQIYDWKGNEKSYTFGGGFEQFKLEYELDEAVEDDLPNPQGRWKRLKKWGKALKITSKAKAKGARRYEIETWSRRS